MTQIRPIATVYAVPYYLIILFLKDKIISKLFNTLNERRMSKEKEVEISTSSESEKEEVDSDLWIHYALVLDRLGFVVFLFSLVTGCAYIFIGIIYN